VRCSVLPLTADVKDYINNFTRKFVSMKKMKWLGLISICLVIFGCSSSADLDRVIVDNNYGYQFKDSITGQIRVEYVSGASNTGNVYHFGLSNKEFKKSMEVSLRSYYLLAVESKPSYNLTASFLSVDYPSMGSDLYFDSEVRYVLVSRNDNKIVFDKIIKSKGVATIQDAFLSTTRLKIAAERAAHRNIKLFLSELEQHQL